MTRGAPRPAPLQRLGERSVAQFMRDDWRRRPALLRKVFAPGEFVIRPQHLFALAARDDVESRLVTSSRGRWQLRHGPFAAGALPLRRQRDWTLLVQGINLVEPRADDLLARFRFLPDARLDDVMASYAVAGGGVGAHVDSYDVFLVQTRGRRRWRISRQRDHTMRSGVPLRLLADFRSEHEWIVEPGDVLYLPPGVAHEGTALDDCITCSVGFRSPPWSALLEPLLDVFGARAGLQQHYRDRSRRLTHRPAQLPPAMLRQFATALGPGRVRAADLRDALLMALSEPKPVVQFRERRPNAAGFHRGARQHGVVLDPATRFMYAAPRMAINGELLTREMRCSAALRRLADVRGLAPHECASLDEASVHLLAGWYGAGWLHFGS